MVSIASNIGKYFSLYRLGYRHRYARQRTFFLFPPKNSYQLWTVDTSPSIHLVPSFSLSVLFLQISCSLSLGLCCRPSGSARECLDGRVGMYTIGVPMRLFTLAGVPTSPATTVAEDELDSSVGFGSLTTSTWCVLKISSGLATPACPPEKDPRMPLAVVQVPTFRAAPASGSAVVCEGRVRLRSS